MDWHSSGITTSVLGALKRGLAPLEHELGSTCAAAAAAHSRKTPGELRRVGERTGLDGDALARTSRLVAKVDSAAVQDGYQLYLHGFIVTATASGASSSRACTTRAATARRYHWLSEGLTSFVDSPHAAIEGRSRRATSSTSRTCARRAVARRASRWCTRARRVHRRVAPPRLARHGRWTCSPTPRLSRICSCPPTTTCAPATSTCGGCTGPSPRRPSAARRISTTCC